MERRRADADVLHRRALRVGGLRARALARAHAARRRRAGQRRPARANRRLAVDGQRRRAEKPRPGSPHRPAPHRDGSVALARRRRHGRHARGRPRARGPLRSGVAAHRDADRTGQSQPLPKAARRRGARPLRARFADEACRAAPAFDQRRAVRAIQARVPRDRAVDHRAARRGARRRAGRPRAQALARSPGRLRPARRRGRAAAAQRAELGGSAHGSLPLARVRRSRGPQRAGPAPRRLGAPGTA